MTGYVPGELPEGSGWIKLNANENPYPPSPRAIAAMHEAIETVSRYPESTSRRVREAASECYQVPTDHIMVTNGSDEMLRILFQGCVGEGEEVVAFTPSYTYYATLASIQNASYREIPFTESFDLPREFDVTKAKLVLLPNPNAPTGTLFSLAEIERLCAATTQGLVVIDEAYADFAGYTALPLLAKHSNLVVTRSLSKSHGLAGLRVGLGFASPSILRELEKVRDYYNVDRIAQKGAEAALRDGGYLEMTLQAIRATRERLAQRLQELGFYVWPSAANFLLCRVPSERRGHPPLSASEWLVRLKAKKILVRHFPHPRISDCLRISIGTDEEVDALLVAIEQILSSP